MSDQNQLVGEEKTKEVLAAEKARIRREKKELIEQERIAHKKLGQYFTTDQNVQSKMLDWISNVNEIRERGFLEPGAGRGDLVKAVLDRFGSEIQYDAYEVDQGLEFQVDQKKFVFEDFLEVDFGDRKYPLIIGNPPFVKTKKGNLYIDFVRKSLDLLEDNGELIFIIPSGFFKMTRAVELIQKMMNEGSITHIYHPDDEKLFDQAAVDILIFRYCKDASLEKIVNYNEVNRLICNSHGLITFVDRESVSGVTVGDLFHCYVGLVSGKESVFKNSEIGNIEILNDEGVIDRYVLVKKFPTGDAHVDNYLEEHRDELMDRKIRKFGTKNWFQWGALRNMNIMEMYRGEDCLYVRALTRQERVCFQGKIDYFGGRLIMLKPKSEEELAGRPSVDLEAIMDWMNSQEFQKHFQYAGRFKIGQRQLVNSVLPPKLAKRYTE